MNKNALLHKLSYAVSALSAAFAACVLWRMGTSAAVLLSLTVLATGLAAGAFWLFGARARKSNESEWARPVATETRLNGLRTAAFQGLIGRALVIATGALCVAVMLAVAFPGQMGVVPLQACVIAIALLAFVGLVTAFGSEQGWGLDAVVPDIHLRERLADLDALSRFEAGWSMTGRIDALREAAALHPATSPAAKALLMAQYAPTAVPLVPRDMRKSVGDEIRLRLLGWRVVVTVAGSAALLSLLLSLLVPPGLWERYFSGVGLSALSVSEREKEEISHDEEEGTDDGSASAQSENGAGGAGGDGQGEEGGEANSEDTGNAGSGHAGGDDLTSDAASAAGANAGAGAGGLGEEATESAREGEGERDEAGAAKTGKEPGIGGPDSDGAGGSGGGSDTVGENSPSDAAQGDVASGQVDQTDLPGSDGSSAGEEGGAGANDILPEGSDNGTGLDGAGADEAEGEDVGAASPSGGTGEQTAAEGDGLDEEIGDHQEDTDSADGEAASGMTKDGGELNESVAVATETFQAEPGADGKGTGAEVDGMPSAADRTVMSWPDRIMDEDVIIDQRSPTETEGGERVDYAIEAKAPEDGLAQDVSVGAAAQLFAGDGEVPDTVLLELPIDRGDTFPEMAEPDVPRQLLPAWINELVN